MTCNHDEDKMAEYLPAFDDAGEVWRCQCGALINIANPDNFGGGAMRAMTAEEIETAVGAVVEARLSKARLAVREVFAPGMITADEVKTVASAFLEALLSQAYAKVAEVLK